MFRKRKVIRRRTRMRLSERGRRGPTHAPARVTKRARGQAIRSGSRTSTASRMAPDAGKRRPPPPAQRDDVAGRRRGRTLTDAPARERRRDEIRGAGVEDSASRQRRLARRIAACGWHAAAWSTHYSGASGARAGRGGKPKCQEARAGIRNGGQRAIVAPKVHAGSSQEPILRRWRSSAPLHDRGRAAPPQPRVSDAHLVDAGGSAASMYSADDDRGCRAGGKHAKSSRAQSGRGTGSRRQCVTKKGYDPFFSNKRGVPFSVGPTAALRVRGGEVLMRRRFCCRRGRRNRDDGHRPRMDRRERDRRWIGSYRRRRCRGLRKRS